MRTILFTFLLTTFSLIGYGQSWVFYKPNGEVVTADGTVSNTAEKYFNTKYFESYSISEATGLNRISKGEGVYAVIFKPFSDEPIFVLGGKTTKEEIEKAIKTFDLYEWFNSMYYKFLLDDMIDNEHLTDVKLYKYFGKPTSIEETRTKQIYIYKNINTEFEVIGGAVKDYVIKN